MTEFPAEEDRSETRPLEEDPSLGVDEAPSAQHDLDERWTVPWALIAGDASRGVAALEWRGGDSQLALGPYTIPSPMLYVSEGCPAEAEASCIDMTLEIGTANFDATPNVAHWSTYASLNPVQRANYIEWLASGRLRPLQDINYAFLYFYGIERHALIDRGDPEHVLRVLMRLLKHYEAHPSFFSNVSRLAAFLFATKGIEKLKPAWFKRLFALRAVPLHRDSIAVALTWLHERGKPLPASLAFEVARQDMRCARSGDYLRDKTAFRRRFEKRYTDTFGEGLVLQCARAKRTWKYRPVNPTLQSWEHFAKLWSVAAPDVMGASDQFTPLVDLWRDVLGNDRSLEDSPWEALIQKHRSAEGRVLIPVRELAQVAEVSIAPDVAPVLEDSLAIAREASAAGFELLPQPRVLLRPWKWDEHILLIRLPEEPSPDSEQYYLAGALLLALGTSIAAADGDVDQLEVLHVSEIVNSLFHFNDYDKHRLGVLRQRLLKFPPKLTSLIRRLRAILNEGERAEAGAYLVGVAGANFRVGDEERQALRRVWRAFELPPESLDARLRVLIPDSKQPDGISEGPVNRDALARLMGDTKHFAVRLGDALQEIVAIKGEEAGKRGIWYERRGAQDDRVVVRQQVQEREPYRDGLYALLQRPDWTEAEFLALGEKEGVFVKGAVQPIEVWTLELADADSGRMVLSSEED